MLNAVAHQSSMQELDLLNPQLDPRISYAGGPKWYFGPDGLLRESRGNFITASEDFTAGIWARNTGVTVTANAAQAPNGTMTADAVTYNGAGAAGSFRIYTTVLNSAPAGLQACSSIWLRSDTPITIKLSTNQNNKTVQVTTQWQRFDCSFAGNGAVNWQLAIYSATGDNTPFTLHMWGAQAEKGRLTPGYYLPTAGAVAYEWPLEYDPITLQPLGRSVWEQRTNLITRSQQSGTSRFGITETDNASVAPDGTTTMVLQTNDGAGGQHWKQVANAWPAAATPHTYSIFIKKGTANFVHFMVYGIAAYAQFNLTTGALVYSDPGSMSGFSASLAQTLPGGYLRFTITATNTTGSSTHLRVYFLDAAQNAVAPTEYSTSTGYWWGEQMESAAYPGPYIPTAGAQVTRQSDRVELVDLRSVRFNQPGGQTVEIEYRFDYEHNHTHLNIMNETAAQDTDWLIYSNNNPTSFIARMYGGAGGSGAHFGGVFTENVGAINKGVVAADQSSTGGTLNGATPVSNTNCLPPTSGLISARIGQIGGGSSNIDGHIRRITFRPYKATPAEQVALTA